MRRTGVVVLLMMAVTTGCATTPSLEDSARRGLYLDTHPTLPPAVRAAVQSGDLIVGMSREMVVAAVGWPVRTEQAASPNSVYECWIYGDTRYDSIITYLYFKGEMLAGFDQRESPALAIAQARLGIDRGGRDPGRQEPALVGMK